VSPFLGPPYTSCESFIPASTNNANVPKLCDPGLDMALRDALAAEAAGLLAVTALWAKATTLHR
jgi:hypothetical protein